MTLHFSPRINSHYPENLYRVYADTDMLRHVLSEFFGLTLPTFIHKHTV